MTRKFNELCGDGFRKVLGYDEAKATKHMLEVHEEGRSVV